MVLFSWEKFKVDVSIFSVGRALKSIGWTKKNIRRVANGRNADLRDLYIHNTSDFLSYQYIFVDEYGCDKELGIDEQGGLREPVT